MAKLTGPLFSLEASGTIGEAVTYSNWKGRAYARARVVPNNPRSALQTGIRAMFAFIAAVWDGLSAPDRATWDAAGEAAQYSGFNAYVKANMDRWVDAEAPTQASPAAEAQTPTTVSAMTLTGGAGIVTIDLTLTAATNQWGIAIFRSTSAITALTRANLVKILDVGGDTTHQYVDSGLAAGTWHYRAAAFTQDGVLGTAIADATATVT